MIDPKYGKKQVLLRYYMADISHYSAASLYLEGPSTLVSEICFPVEISWVRHTIRVEESTLLIFVPAFLVFFFLAPYSVINSV